METGVKDLYSLLQFLEPEKRQSIIMLSQNCVIHPALYLFVISVYLKQAKILIGGDWAVFAQSTTSADLIGQYKQDTKCSGFSTQLRKKLNALVALLHWKPTVRQNKAQKVQNKQLKHDNLS